VPDGVVVRYDEPLSRHVAWRTGGPCEVWLVVHRAEALLATLAACRAAGLALTILGAGTRTLVRDGGLAGAVVRLGTGFATARCEGERWDVGAAVPLPALVATAAAAGASGIEDLAAIPGTFGASLALDAGPGAGWAGIVRSVRFVTRGRAREGTFADLRAAGPRALVLGASLRLSADHSSAVLARVRARRAGAVALRAAWTPASSWYTAPARASLREVLGRAGLGDVRLRAAVIPAAAPELVVNLGGATTRDLMLLHHSAMERVRRECGVELAPRLQEAGRAGNPEPTAKE
jgi:UDP-N-acetylmuramate dehydrogenase